MSIRPVDYQILMPKVNEMAKIQSSEHQKVMGQVQQQAESSIKQAHQDTQSVHSQKEAQKTVITEKHKNQGRGKGQEKKEKDAQDENKKKSDQLKPRIQGRHTIDIRL